MPRQLSQPGLLTFPPNTTAAVRTQTLPLPSRGWRQPAWLTLDRRMFAVFALVWVLHMFDLRFTLLEHFGGHFLELNPIANWLLGHSIVAITAFKLGLLTFATTILWVLRRHSIAVTATWLLLAASLFVMVKWAWYFQVMPAEIKLRLPPLPLN
jgi:hypothetical protein